MELSKDKLIPARSTIRKKDSKGRDVLTVYYTPEEVENIIACLEATRGNEKGAKMTFHTEKKTSQEGRAFDSTFGFVKAVSEGGGGFGGARPAGRFVPKVTNTTDRDAKIAGINAKKLG